MESYDGFFSKWPKWLRWTLFLPLSFVASFGSSFLATYLLGYNGWAQDSLVVQIAIAVTGLAGLFITIYMCVPKFKEIITGISSFLWGAVAIVAAVVAVNNGNWQNWNFIIVVAQAVVCLIFGIKLFLLYASNKAKGINKNFFIE